MKINIDLTKEEIFSIIWALLYYECEIRDTLSWIQDPLSKKNYEDRLKIVKRLSQKIYEELNKTTQ